MPAHSLSTGSNTVVQKQLDSHLSVIERVFGGSDGVVINGPLLGGVDDFIRDAVEEGAVTV